MRPALLSLLGLLALAGPARADPPARQGVTRTPAPAAVPAEGVVNINTASAEELERLPGVGPARAASIIALRDRVRRFQHAEDLLRVRGIGRVGFRRMRPHLVLEGATTLETRPRPAR